MATKISPKTFYGSGSVYEIEYDRETMQIPTTQQAVLAFAEEYCIEENQIGYLKKGFQVNVTTNTLEDQSDLGEMKISLITKEEAKLVFALFNANGETISRLYPTAETKNGITVVGGLKGKKQAEHIIIFVAADESEGKTIVIAVGKNTSGFTLNWNPDSVEPMSCEYKVVPYNTEGNFLVVADLDKE